MISVSLLTFSIWWDIIIIHSFNFLDMLFFGYLNIFIIDDLKSFLVSPTSWLPQVHFLLSAFLFHHMDLPLLFLWMPSNFFWILDILNNVLCLLWALRWGPSEIFGGDVYSPAHPCSLLTFQKYINLLKACYEYLICQFFPLSSLISLLSIPTGITISGSCSIKQLPLGFFNKFPRYRVVWTEGALTQIN